MADTKITLTIPEAKVQRIVNAMKGLYPIPQSTDKDDNTTNDFTDNAWAKEALRRLIVRDVQRWETKVAQDAAVVEPDDDIVS